MRDDGDFSPFIHFGRHARVRSLPSHFQADGLPDYFRHATARAGDYISRASGSQSFRRTPIKAADH